MRERAAATTVDLFEQDVDSTEENLGEVTVLMPQDALITLRSQKTRVTVTMLDPWYNRGAGGTREDYDDFLGQLLQEAARISDHIFLWGFPEIVCSVLQRVPQEIALVAWLTWYFKNCPSVIRGWRSAQMACLHFAKPNTTLYPERFLTPRQLELKKQGKLRYMPGPPSVIEAPLNVGFVGRKEQAGHPAQKPEAVFEPLLLMTTQPGDTVLDPMCGSGTTGAVCRRLGRNAILCDESEDYLQMTERRLELKRASRRRSTS